MEYVIGGGVVVVLVIAVGILWHYRPRRRTVSASDVQRLRVWTAEQLSTLTVEQQEAMRLWAWAERQNWMVVTENVNLGNEFPRAKEALLS